MKNLKSLLIGVSVAVLSSCGPDVTNQYYYGGSGSERSYDVQNGSFTCDDFAEKEAACYSNFEEARTYPDFVQHTFESKRQVCEDMFEDIGGQACLDCVRDADCTFVPSNGRSDPQWVSPADYCFQKGKCLDP